MITENVGTLTYPGHTVYKDGRPPTTIPQKAVTSNTVLEGEDVLKLEVELIPDLLDWDQLKLVTVKLSYVDSANGIDESDTFTLRKGVAPMKWSVNIKDKAKKTYKVAPRFFLTDGTKKEPPPFDATDESLVLEATA